MDYRKILIHKVRHNAFRIKDLIKWLIIATAVGALLGAVGAAFFRGIALVTRLRLSHPVFLYLLPLGAILIRLAYRHIGKTAGRGTNLVLKAIQAGSIVDTALHPQESDSQNASDSHIPLRMAPLIFVSTILSHLLGASVGREGAALQLGGSTGEYLAAKLKLNKDEKKTMIMLGMSATFSAMLGTPIAASIFSLEVVSVGIMHYSALLPCVVGSFIARFVAHWLGIPDIHYDLGHTVPFDLYGMLMVLGLAFCCGITSVIFCASMHQGEKICERIFKTEYLQALVMGSLLLGLTLLSGSQTYNGTGSDYIHTCLEGEGFPGAFLVKILFTCVSILAGYKGGEIVPSFFIGASLGSLYGNLVGYDSSLTAALGMAGVFCGVTNCPISSLLIFCELFGFDCAPYALLTCTICYVVSGYYGLYTDQRIIYSKFRSNVIDKKTN